jgi:extracellular elastinolytic metalloproteinase
MRRPLAILISILVLAGFAPAQAATPKPARLPGGAELSDGTIDVRAGLRIAPRTEALRAAAGLVEAVPDLNVTWNPRYGTAKMVFSAAGYLTAPSRLAATDIARSFVMRSREMFGLSSNDVRALAVDRDATLPGTGMHAIVFHLVTRGIRSFDGTVGVNVARDGRIATVWSQTGPSGTLAARPALSAEDALRTMAKQQRVTISDVAVRGVAKGAARLTVFNARGLYMRPNARLVSFPTSDGPRLAWRVFFPRSEREIYSSVVDAMTGQVLFRSNQVKDYEGKVYENYPGAPLGGTQKIVSFDATPESPLGWVGIPANASTNITIPTTFGNNAFAFTDWGRTKLAPAGLALFLAQVNPIPDYAPVAPDGKFNFDFQNNWGKSCTPMNVPRDLVADPPANRVVENPSYIQDRDPSVTNIFYLVNKIHDLAYRLGFTEEMGNFQWENFGKRPEGGKDPVRYSAMAGILNGALDNANMWTPPDGGEPADIVESGVVDFFPPHGNMYLWRTVPGFAAPCVDGDQDASIAWHEYTHGITNRVVGGPENADALSAAQSGSMGEAWSDWFALHFLFEAGLENRVAEGIYATGNTVTGIRNYSPADTPLTYGDFGFGLRGPEVHDDGEIWVATLWDLRSALIAKYGKAEGGKRAGHLVFDGLVHSPALPTFLNMRDAILKGDTVRYSNQDRDMIWRVFALRGMGKSAKSPDADDIHPTPGFDVPGTANGTLSGVLTDADGGALKNVKVVIGLGEGAPSAAVLTGSNGSFSLKLTPGTYNLTYAAAGYGLQPQGKITIAVGGGVVKSATLAKNLASVGWGSKVTAGVAEGDPGIALIDDHEFSTQLMTVGTPVVVQLGGTAPARVRAVSIAERPGGNRLRAALAYTAEVSVDGKKWRTVRSEGVKIVKPRPGTREVARSFATVAGIPARFVRITVTKTLGGGTVAAIAGLEVFGSAPGVKLNPVGGDPALVESGTITLANAGGGGAGGGASITENEWLNKCQNGLDAMPVTQGLDGWVVQLPDNAGDGVHFFEVINSGGTSTDLDAYFWNADCTATLGQAATGAASEAGPLPPGSRWALIILFAGTTDGFQTRVTTTLERTTPPTKVAGIKIPANPRPGDLPATGVADTAGIGLLALAIAALGTRRLRRGEG